jgi:hypothetical protein
MTERLRALRDDDSGAMLIVALIIITSVAVVTGALLTHGGTNFRATVALEGVAGTSYAADSAAKIAVNDLRLGAKAPGWVAPTFPGSWADWVFTNNADGTGCFGAEGTLPKNSLVLKNLYPKAGDQTADSSARVECSVVPGTGIFGAGKGVGIEDPEPIDAFARSLTTVGTTGVLHGMRLKPLGTGNTAAMPVRGGIASKSYITVDTGALVTDGYVKAEDSCTGVIVSNPAKACNQPGSVPMPVVPPSPLTSVPVYRDPSAYSATAPVVAQRCRFQPGFYNNAKALSDAVNSCTTAQFASGKYYFDFNDEKHGGQNIWNITKTVIGGEYVGGTIPGTCKSPIVNDPVTGVQFVFGGTSRMTVSDTAHVELCGPSDGGEPPLTLYQQPTGSAETPVVLPAQAAQTVEQVTGAKIDAFTTEPTGGTPQGALAAEGGGRLAWVSTKKDQQAAVDLRNFSGLSTIAVGADISSAEVRIRYEKSVDAPSLTLDVTGTSTVAPVTVPSPDATGWASVDIGEHLRTLIGTGSFDAGRPRLELRLPAAPDKATLKVDAVSLAVTYLPPALHAATEVASTACSSPSLPCFIYAPGGNFHGEFVVQGAAFLPKGYVDLDPGSFDSALVAFRWGLVASGVNLKAQPSQTFGYPLVSMPVAGHGLGNKVTVVDLEVFVCVEQSTCSTGGTHALTVRAAVTDPPYSAWGSGPARPEPGRRKVEILSWSEQR